MKTITLLLDERSNLWVMRLRENENVPLVWNKTGTFSRGKRRYTVYSQRDLDVGTVRAIVLAYHEGLLEQVQPAVYSWEA